MSNLVYSTETGRITQPKKEDKAPTGDGIVRIRWETKGRKGKGVTTVSGLALESDALKNKAKALKKLCGVGGSIKNFVIEIQGEHKEKIKAHLESEGYKVKIAGG